MEFSVLTVTPAQVETACLVVPLFQDGDLLSAAAKLDDASERLLAQLVERGDIKPKDKVLLFNTGAAQKYPQAVQLDLTRLDLASPIPWDQI
mgnify:CR=1 FL=1